MKARMREGERGCERKRERETAKKNVKGRKANHESKGDFVFGSKSRAAVQNRAATATATATAAAADGNSRSGGGDGSDDKRRRLMHVYMSVCVCVCECE